MDCYKNFTLSLGNTYTFSTPGTDVKTWGLAPNLYWNCENNLPSQKNITGFKNINIYQVKMIGNVFSTLGANSAIVEDFRFGILLNGQTSIIGGTISPNGYGLVDTTSLFFLSKYNSQFLIPDGSQSVTDVQIISFYAQGYGAENAGIVSLRLDLDFIFYYKFEGE